MRLRRASLSRRTRENSDLHLSDEPAPQPLTRCGTCGRWPTRAVGITLLDGLCFDGGPRCLSGEFYQHYLGTLPMKVDDGDYLLCSYELAIDPTRVPRRHQ
jgi:hypothetical protein